MSLSLSEPSFGHFNKDELLDVVIEEDAGNNTKRVGSGLCRIIKG